MSIIKKLCKVFASLITVVIALAVIYMGYLFISSGFDFDVMEERVERLFDDVENAVEPYGERIDELGDNFEDSLDSVGERIENTFESYGD